MSEDKKKEQVKIASDEVGEDATQYGEFISSFHAWVPLEKQREIVKRLENVTKEEVAIEKKEEM